MIANEQQPMRDARLAEIRTAMEDRSQYSESFGIIDTADMGMELLAEMERLRAREATLMASMRKLLEIADLAQYYSPGELGEFPDKVDHNIKQARALLASAGEQAAQGEA